MSVAASLLASILSRKGVMKAVEETIRASQNFQCRTSNNFEIQNIIKKVLNLMVFIQEVTYLK